MEPITKLSLGGRAVAELASLAGVSVVAMTVTTEEVAVAVTVIGLLLGGVVWLVRLEGRINTHNEILARLDRRMERLADHMGVPE